MPSLSLSLSRHFSVEQAIGNGVSVAVLDFLVSVVPVMCGSSKWGGGVNQEAAAGTDGDDDLAKDQTAWHSVC